MSEEEDKKEQKKSEFLEAVAALDKVAKDKGFQEKFLEDVLSNLPIGNLKDLSKQLGNNVFNWDNNATRKPALDSFLKVSEGYGKLSKTFNEKQKEIADETDFKENLASMVGLMRKQIETSEQETKNQTKRFYASTAIALVSVAIAVIAISL